MKLRLLGTSTSNLKLSELSEIRAEGTEATTGFRTSFHFPPQAPQTFYVVFEMELYLGDKANLELEYCAEFKCDEDIDEEFRNSAFVGVNAPAIAYPFMRAFISAFCAISGHEPVILPPVNFQSLYNKKLSLDAQKEHSNTVDKFD